MLLNKVMQLIKQEFTLKITHQLEKDAQEACLWWGVNVAKGQGSQSLMLTCFLLCSVKCYQDCPDHHCLPTASHHLCVSVCSHVLLLFYT